MNLFQAIVDEIQKEKRDIKLQKMGMEKEWERYNNTPEKLKEQTHWKECEYAEYRIKLLEQRILEILNEHSVLFIIE